MDSLALQPCTGCRGLGDSLLGLNAGAPLPGDALARLSAPLGQTLPAGTTLSQLGMVASTAVLTSLYSMLTSLLAPANQRGGNAPVNGAATPNNAAGAVAPSNTTPGDQGQAKGNIGVWNEKDEQMLEKAISGSAGGNQMAVDQTMYDKIFSQFGQSQEGNCASVAVIKAAMDKYKGKVFQEVKKMGDGYAITQQDGKQIQISRSELATAAKAAKFKGEPNEVKSMAILMFAVIAKRGSQEGMGSFDNALRDLNNGFNSKKAAKLLGLGHKIKDVSTSTSEDSVVAYSGRHAVYVDSGKTDHYGRAKAFDRTDTNGRSLNGAFTFA